MPKRECYKFIVYFSHLHGWKGFHSEAEMFQAFQDEGEDYNGITIFRATAHGSVEANKIVPYFKLNPIEVKD